MSLHKPSSEELDAASPKELAQFAGPALDRLPVGRLPYEVFVPIRRLAVLSTVEVIAFQTGTEAERVLIGQRGKDPGDRWWQGKLNLPGSVILPNEDLEEDGQLVMSDGRPVDIGEVVVSSDLTKPADRILDTEFRGSVARTSSVRELERHWVRAESGTENKTWVWTEADLADGHEGVLEGDFYDTQEIINNPPRNLVHGHPYFVEQGLFAFRALVAQQG